MARFLIVGGGEKATALAGALGRDGNALSVIEDAERLGPVLAALEHVAVVCWLVRASPEHFLLGAIDSSMRGFVYEAGDWESSALETTARNSIPAVGIRTDSAADLGVWLTAARQAVEYVLSGRYAGSIYLKADRFSGKASLPARLLDKEEIPMSAYAKDVLVEPEWLQEHLSDDSIRIVEVDENPGLYAEAHIPGAIGFDWKEDLQDPVRRDFLGPEDFSTLFSGSGISSDHTVVLYGDRNNWFAAYTYWYLKYYGHDKVLLLNGPREKWIADGRPTSPEAAGYEPASFNAKPGDDTIRARRDEVLAAVGDSTNLVDVRSPAEFAGEIISPSGYEQEGAQRAGHIPGAASIPWAQAVNEDGTFKSAEQLRELYGSKGVLDGKDVIAYCRIGERSAHTWFVLHELLGQERVKNYDGSWTEWGSLVGVPVEKGA